MEGAQSAESEMEYGRKEGRKEGKKEGRKELDSCPHNTIRLAHESKKGTDCFKRGKGDAHQLSPFRPVASPRTATRALSSFHCAANGGCSQDLGKTCSDVPPTDRIAGPTRGLKKGYTL